MSDLQIDFLAAFVFIGGVVYHLLVDRPHSKKDEAFYIHLTVHSPLFPRWRIVFPIVWTLLWVFNGVGAYLFWHAYAPGDDTTFLVGLIFYAISFVFQCGWYNMFFRRRMFKITFFMTLIVIEGSAIGYFVCTIIYPQVVAAVAAGLLVVWIGYATLLSAVVAFSSWGDHTKASSPVDESGTDDGYQGYDPANAQIATQNVQASQGKFAPVGSAAVQRKGTASIGLQLPK